MNTGTAQTRYEYDTSRIERARKILGTSGIKDTLDAALQDVIDRNRRNRLLERLRNAADIDLSDDKRRDAWS